MWSAQRRAETFGRWGWIGREGPGHAGVLFPEQQEATHEYLFHFYECKYSLYFSDQILLVFLVNTILLKSKSMIFYSEPLLFTVTTFTKVFIWEWEWSVSTLFSLIHSSLGENNYIGKVHLCRLILVWLAIDSVLKQTPQLSLFYGM